MATAAQSDSVLELYSAYFNRAADATGLTFWKNSFDTFLAGADATATDAAKELFALQKIAEDMSAATEYVALYPATQTSTEFVNAVYTNLLDRASDAEGLAFWVGHIDGATLTKEQAIVNMIDGAKNNTTAEGIADAALIANKNAVSKYFAETLASDDLTVAATAFTGVTDDAATVTTANAALDVAVAAASALQFTTNNDNLSGTAANDTIASADGTLQSSDVLIDTSSTDADVLNITSVIYDSTVTPVITGIETINVDSPNLTGLNLSSITGVQTLNLSTSAAGGTATADNVTASKVAKVVAGTNVATLNINANSSGTGSNVNVDAGSATAVSIAGGTASDLFTITLADTVTDLSLLSGGGSGDKFTANLIGTGTSGLNLTVDPSTTGTLSELILSSTTAASVLNLATVNPLATKLTIVGDQDITFAGSAAAFSGVELVDGNTGVSTLKLTTGLGGNTDLSDLAFNVIDMATASSAAATLLANKSSQIKLSTDLTATSTPVFAGTTSSSLSVDLVSSQTGTIIIQAADAFISIATATTLGSVALTNTTAATSLLGLNIAKVTTTALTGDQDLSITTLTGTSATATHFDASAFTGTLKIDGIGTGAKVTGGAGADSITGGTANDTLDGGAGNDVLALLTTAGTTSSTTATTGDQLTGGAGSDTFVINGTGGATITDFVVADDTIQLSLTTADTATTSTNGVIDGNSADVTTTSAFSLVQAAAATNLSPGQAIITLTGATYANIAAVETAIETGGTRALTLGTTSVTGDNLIVAWNKTDGSAVVSSVELVTAGTTLATGTGTTAIDLVTLTGVDATTLTAADFDFIV